MSDLEVCNNSPATADETQTTAATPRTAATPGAGNAKRDHQQRGNQYLDKVKPRSGLDEP
jgi:hypothetical protein